MSALIPFEFGAKTIRVIEIDGEPWFVAKDVADALGYANSRKTVVDHCRKAQPVGGVTIRDPHGLDPQTAVIPEADVWRLIMRSRKPEARRLEAKIVEEILPAVRKTGQYGSYQVQNPQLQAIQALVVQADQMEQRMLAVEDEQDDLRRRISAMDGDTGYMTVLAYGRDNDIPLPFTLAQAVGRWAANYCRAQGINIGTIPDERFGRVNSYPVNVLSQAVQEVVHSGQEDAA